MNPVGALIVYILIWWLVFFATLPRNVKGVWENREDYPPGIEPGAPQDPQMKKKFIRASLIAAMIWVPVMLVIASGIFNFRNQG